MTVLTETIKASRMTKALSALEAEYMASADKAERACAKTVHRANFDLPDYSKARLFDILTTGA